VHVIASVLRSLTDCIRDLTRLADAKSDLAVVIANDDHCTKGETTAALQHFRRAGHMDHALVELLAFLFTLTRGSAPATAATMGITPLATLTTLTAVGPRALAIRPALPRTAGLKTLIAWHRSS
jgi:hypothetical protein